MKSEYSIPAIFCSVLISVLLSGCVSGKKAFEQGNYVQAVLSAVERLRESPGNKKAVQVLAMSYPEAVKVLDAEVQEKKISASPDVWSTAVRNYDVINRLYDEIRRSPAAMKVISAPEQRFKELAEARQLAAEEFYQAGIASMMKGTREESKQAYFNFTKAIKLVPEYKQAIEFSNQAKQDATLHVVVEPVMVNRTGWDFEAAIFGSRRNEFVKLMTPDQVRTDSVKRIDHYLALAVNGFAQSNPVVTRKSQDVVDSVKTGEKKVGEKVIPVMTAVNARVTTFEKSIQGRGSVVLRVFDARSRAEIANFDIESVQQWSDQWAVYTGDARALSGIFRRLVEKRESMPPDHILRNMVRQDLERKIAARVTDYYRTY
jgi:hypothetical protein